MTLKLHTSTRNELQALNQQALDLERKMVVDQHRFLLEFSGLHPFLEVLRSRSEDVHFPTLNYLTVSPLSPEIHNSQSRISKYCLEHSKISSQTP